MTHRVLPNPLEGWDIKRDGNRRASLHCYTHEEAVAAGREISRNQGTMLVIYNEDSQVVGREGNQSDESHTRSLNGVQRIRSDSAAGNGVSGTGIHRVLPNPDEGWDIVRDGNQRASLHCYTREEAIAAGRSISRNQGTELVIHGADGLEESWERHDAQGKGKKARRR